MIRIAIDTNTINRIVDTPQAHDQIKAAMSGSFLIIGNHVLKDELEETTDPDRRSKLRDTYKDLVKATVPTAGFVMDTSRLDQAGLGTGAESGISVANAMTRGRGRLHDALVATTASGQANVLVTDDSNLRKKVQASAARCEVWSFQDFMNFVRQAERRQP